MNESFGKFTNDRAIRLGVVASLTLLAFFLLVTSIVTLRSSGRNGMPATDTITVTGDGQATLAPDVAHVSFTVQNTAASVADAQSKTTEQMNKALEAVKELGVEDKDVKTLSYNISPQYSYPNPCPVGALCPGYMTPKISGYEVSQSVQVTVHDLTKAGDLLAGLGKLGVQNLSGPAFALDDSTAGYDAARADAIDKAKAEAKRLANQLGVKLGKIVNFSESSGGNPYPIAYGLGGAVRDTKMEVSPNVPVGENTYKATVSITYEIR